MWGQFWGRFEYFWLVSIGGFKGLRLNRYKMAQSYFSASEVQNAVRQADDKPFCRWCRHAPKGVGFALQQGGLAAVFCLLAGQLAVTGF